MRKKKASKIELKEYILNYIITNLKYTVNNKA